MNEPTNHEEASQYAEMHPESNLARCYLHMKLQIDDLKDSLGHREAQLNEALAKVQESNRLNGEYREALGAILDQGCRCHLASCVCGFDIADKALAKRPKDDQRCPKCRWLPQYCECAEKRNNEAPLVCPHGAIHERGWGTCRLCSEAGVPQAPQRGRDTCVECGANRAHWNSR